MSNTLQEQLLKAGLANKKQAVRAKKAKNHKEKLQRTGVEVVDEVVESAKACDLARVERDRQLNKEKNAASEKKAVQAQIRQLIEMNRLTELGDEEFSFTEDAVIKAVRVTPSQRKSLTSGALAIVKWGDTHAIVHRQVVLKIMERDDSSVVCLHDKSDDYVEDDEYGDYQVPDDLMW